MIVGPCWTQVFRPHNMSLVCHRQMIPWFDITWAQVSSPFQVPGWVALLSAGLARWAYFARLISNSIFNCFSSTNARKLSSRQAPLVSSDGGIGYSIHYIQETKWNLTLSARPPTIEL